jgi:hypothetical protein
VFLARAFPCILIYLYRSINIISLRFKRIAALL